MQTDYHYFLYFLYIEIEIYFFKLLLYVCHDFSQNRFVMLFL